MPLVVLFCGGIAASHGAGGGVTAPLLLICTAAVIYLVPPLRWLALAIGIFALGAALYAARYELWSEDDLRLIVHDKPVLVTIRGRLVDTPSVREFPGRTNTIEFTYARLDVSQVFHAKQWRPASGVVATSTRGRIGAEFFKGRTVEIAGVLAVPDAAAAPGLFDFRQYLYNSRIFYQLRSVTTDWQLRSFEPLPLTERFQRWAQWQLSRGLPFDDEPLRMVRAMALGATQSLSGEVADVFMRTGTMHIFAISGLHVACIAACILTLLRLAGVPRDRSAFILIPLVWFYTLATGWQSSAVRSALMSTFVFAGWAIRRPTEVLNSTAAAAMLILLFEPEQLFQASFQLSFAVVCAIAIILNNVDRETPRWPVQLQYRLLRYDPLLPAELRPAWKRWLEIPLGFLVGNLVISLASWAGSNPLTAYYFNMVTPISLLANLVAVPLSSLSLAATLGSLLIPPLGPLFNYLSWATMWETVQVTRWLSKLSWGYFYVPKPTFWFFAAYFAGCGALFVRALRRPAVYALITCGCFMLIIAGLGQLRTSSITVLQAPGSPVFVDAPGRRNDLLVDCSNARTAEHLVKRFLRAQGVGQVRNLALTQGVADHIGGFKVVQDEFNPAAVFATLHSGRSRVYREIRAALEKLPTIHRTKAGESIAGWQVLYPWREQRAGRAADSAIVLKGEIQGWKVLLLSALGPVGQRSLLEADIGTADVLIASDAVRPDLVAKLSPALLVLQSNEKPFAPRNSKQSDLWGGAPMVVNTRTHGSVTLKLSRTECRIHTTSGFDTGLVKNR